MEFLDALFERNARFAESDFRSDLKMMPSASTVIVGCVDPRVDPAIVFGLKQGETAIVRNIGGRVDKSLLETLGLLRKLSQAAGGGTGMRNLVILQHTDCGIIGCHRLAPELLARHLGVAQEALDGMHIADPHQAVAFDVASLKANDQLPAELVVSGIVYDVKTGRAEIVVGPAPLRPASSD